MIIAQITDTHLADADSADPVFRARAENLRVVAVKDLNLKIGHAVLIVFWADPKTGKKRSLLLDNQIKKVVDSRTIRHYQPVFSINKNYWWRHRS